MENFKIRVEFVSVVIPAYRSAESLPILMDRLYAVLSISVLRFEVVVIDDASPDNTWDVLSNLKLSRPWLKIVRLLKNSGQHNAILCGFTIAIGDVVVTMDDDLQNPPEEIPKLIAAIESGYDLAIGSYSEKEHSASRNFAGTLVDGLQRRIFKLPIDFQLTSFRAIRRVVVGNVTQMATTFPYITAMLLSHTSKYVNVPVRHDPRTFGTSNYNLSKSLRLVFNLLLNYSPYLIYFTIVLCLIALGISFLLGTWVIWQSLVLSSVVPGWASTIAALSFFNGLILLALVVQIFYLSRLNQQISRSRVGFTIGELRE